MGCCHSQAPATPTGEAAFASSIKKNKEHHGGDSNYTLSNVSSIKAGEGKSGYNSRYNAINAMKSADETELAKLHEKELSSSSSDNGMTDTTTKSLLKKNRKENKKDENRSTKKQNITTSPPINNNNTKPTNTNKITSPSKSKQINDTMNVPKESAERERSISKSSRSFRPRNEPNSPSFPKSPPMSPPKNKIDKITDTITDNDNKEQKVDPLTVKTNDNKQQNQLPNFEEDDADSDASSLSGDEEIPMLQLFSDSSTDSDDNDDEITKKMAILVQEENKKIEIEIRRMKSFIEEQDIKKLEEEAMKEIEAEALEANNNEQNGYGEEEEKRRKMRERFEKKQKQREREKVQARERRRIKKEEKKKKKKAALLRKKMAKRQKERIKKRDEVRQKRKKELENYSAPEERPTRKQIINMFDKYFYKPFASTTSTRNINKKQHKRNESNASNSSEMSSDSESDDEELPENGINYDGFKVGIEQLGIDKILSKSQIEMVWDHMTESCIGDGISAVDFTFFLKQNAITLAPKLADIQRKIVATLAKQQDIEDKEVAKKPKKVDDLSLSSAPKTMTIQISAPINDDDDDKKDEEKDDDANDDSSDDDSSDDDEDDDDDDNKGDGLRDGSGSVIVKSAPIKAERNTVKFSSDIILPDPDEDPDDHINKMPATAIQRGETVPDMLLPIKEDEKIDSDDNKENVNGKRRQSLSMSTSISVSQSVMSTTLPSISNLPRASFKKINYNWNDSMSTKAFNNYKKLRQRFAYRYKHTPKQSRHEELMNVQQNLFLKEVEKVEKEEEDEKKEATQPQKEQKEEKQEEKQDDIKNDNEVVDNNDDDEKKEDDDDEKKEDDEDNEEKEMKENINTSNVLGVLHGIDENEEMMKERRSPAKSIVKISHYQGNDEVINLRKLYRKQHKMKKKLEHLRKRSLLKFPAPPKPKNIEKYMNEKVRYVTKELKSCICKNTRYTGLANFGPNGELGIEIEFTSNPDDDGYLTGRRITHFKGNKLAKGKGRVFNDLTWNGHKYLACSRFEWEDTSDGITTIFEFNSVSNELDVDHSFFAGTCRRFPSDLDRNKKTTQLIQHEGFFDFVCVSARRRTIRRNSLLQYHTLDINEMNENELQNVPKYVRRMSAYTEKIDQLYEQDAPMTKDALFGDAIQMASAINGNATTSDGSLPDQISE